MKIFIANWKMELSLTEQVTYCQDNLEALKKNRKKIVLCPSFSCTYQLCSNNQRYRNCTGQLKAAPLMKKVLIRDKFLQNK